MNRRVREVRGRNGTIGTSASAGARPVRNRPTQEIAPLTSTYGQKLLTSQRRITTAAVMATIDSAMPAPAWISPIVPQLEHHEANRTIGEREVARRPVVGPAQGD